MRNFLLLSFIFIIANLNATPELDFYTCKGTHITISVVYRYKNEITELYYKSLTKNLDNYIDSLKQKGKLERGKVHFKIMAGVWMNHSTGVEMYRHKNGYYCWLNGLEQPITQDYLTKIVAYFASDNWESFCYDYDKITPDKALHIFNRIIEGIPVTYQYSSQKILELNDLTLYFQSDSLICKSSDKEYGQIKFLLPFSAGSKDFVTTKDTIYVVENNTVINKRALAKENFPTADIYAQSWVEIYPKWINFRNSEGCFLSYSIEKNKFYKLNNIW